MRACSKEAEVSEEVNFGGNVKSGIALFAGMGV